MATNCQIRTHAFNFPRDALQQEWAATQTNLVLAYWNRVRGERAENLEKAIAAYEAALTVFSPSSTSCIWAGDPPLPRP